MVGLGKGLPGAREKGEAGEPPSGERMKETRVCRCQEAGASSAFPWPLYIHMGLQLIEGIVLVFGNELRAIDGQLLVGIH